LARLYLTGGLVFEGPEGTFGDAALPGNQGRIALAALVVERRPISHDGLADIIWDGAPPERWKSALAAVISKTRSSITATGLDGTAILTSTGGSYAFSPPPDTWIDLEQASRSLDRAEGALRHHRPDEAAREATVASAIFRRPLLAGAECRWLDDVRSRTADALHRALVTLAASWHEIGDHRLASVVAESAVGLDPYREVGHRVLIDALCAQGDRGAAVRALSRCERILTEELGVGPSRETLRIVERLRVRD
jgi:DNA-binding SARP family transcriptional activator